MSVVCKRCESYLYTPYGEERGPDDPYPPALSRTTRGPDDEPSWVCSACGQDEAMIQFQGGHLQPQEEWPVVIQYSLTRPSDDDE